MLVIRATTATLKAWLEVVRLLDLVSQFELAVHFKVFLLSVVGRQFGLEGRGVGRVAPRGHWAFQIKWRAHLLQKRLVNISQNPGSDDATIEFTWHSIFVCILDADVLF